MKKLSLCCCTTLLLSSSAYAANVVDFESIPGSTPVKGMEISTQYQNTNGISFSSSNKKIILVKVGEKPPLSFVSRYNSSGIRTSKENQPNRAAPNSKVGQFMLWTRGRLTITYTNPVAKAYGDIVDIDYSERFTVIAKDINGKKISRKVFHKNSSGAGDGVATRWSFNLPESTIKTVEIINRRGGFAFDNFSSSTTTNICESKKIAEAYTRTGAGENLVAPFTSPSTSTTKSYSGLVEVIVSGTGISLGNTFNDAFFGVKTGKPLDSQYYQLNIGWNGAPLKPYADESRNIANYIKFVDGMGKADLPTYNSNNRYHFVIEVPKDAGRLSFGVSDGGFDDNTGQYNFEIYPVKNNSCQQPPQQDKSIVACYPFDGNAMDSSGNGNHGTIRGAVIKNGVLHIGESKSNLSYASFGRKIDQFRTNNFTVSFWFKTLEKARLFDLAGDRRAGSHGNYLSIRMTGKHESVPEGSVTAEIDQHGGASRMGMISARNGLNDGKWHHTVVVRKANSSALYIDGKLENSKQARGIANIVNNNDFRLGRSYGGFRNAVVQYDNLCIYNQALSANKVKALFIKK